MLDTLLPPVTLDLINFSTNSDFSNFSQFLEKLQKSQFLLDTLLPPVPLDLINLSKNCENLGGGGVKVISEGIDCDRTFDLWNISEGCKKNWPFLWGEAGVLCQYL